MTRADEIITSINSNGGLDHSYIEYAAKQDGVSVREYVRHMIKEGYAAHGNTVNKVLRELL